MSGDDPLIDEIASVTRQREREQEAARPRFEALLKSARRAADLLGDPRQVTSADVDRVVGSVDVPQLDTALLELAGMRREIGVPELLMALGILRALRGTEHEARWIDALRDRASEIIYGFGARALLGLRVRLLDALIEGKGPPVSRWFFARANSRLNAGIRDAGVESLVLRDFEAAMDAARRDNDVEALADAVAAWVKVVVHQPTPDPERVNRARALVEQALALEPSPERQASLLQSRAYVVRLRDPRAAADVFEEAAAKLRPDDPLRWEVSAESIGALTAAGAATLAAERAERLLDAAPAGGPDLEVTMLMLEASEAFFGAGRPRAAVRSLLETGLERARGRDGRLEATIHIRLARLELLEGDVASAERHVAHAWDHSDTMDPGIRTDVHQIQAQVQAARRDSAASAASMTRAVDAARGTVDEVAVRLLEASLQLTDSRIPDGLDALVVDALGGEGIRRDVVELLEQISCDHGSNLAPATLAALSDWARGRGRRNVEARLLLHRDDRVGARAVLRRALADREEPQERLACASLLVVILDEGDRDERAGLCDELEVLLGERDDMPQIRMNLATALRADAARVPTRLLRAWRHGLRALRVLRDADAAHGHHELARIVLEHARATLGRPSPERAELCGWLAGDHPGEQGDVNEAQLEVALHLLVLGPLSRAEDIDLTRRLVTSAERVVGGTQQVRVLRERCEWVEASIQGSVWSRVRPQTLGPFDDAPGWFVALFAGRMLDVAIETADDVLQRLLPHALDARPDRADEVLASLVASSPRLDRGARSLVTALAREVVRTPRGWTRTREAIARAPTSPEADARDSVQRLFEEARLLMDGVRVEIPPRDAPERIARARTLLGNAVAIAREHRLPDLFNVLVSLGNAWKTPPDTNLENALTRYAEAEALGGDDGQLARLWKVRADALHDRGGDDDRREAALLLERSAALRSGWLRGESLASAARVAAVHPDLDEVGRSARAAEFLLEAARADPDRAEPVLPQVLRHLSRWAQLRPQDPRPPALVRELQELFPGRRAELTLEASLVDEALAERARSTLEHPATAAYIRETTEFALLGAAPPTSMAEMQTWIRTRVEQALSNPNLLEQRLAVLERRGEPEEEPGRAVARVVFHAALTRLVRRRLADVRRATDVATDLVASVTDGTAQAVLLRELSRVWAPVDHLGDPVRDFDLAADLAARAVVAEGGEERASLESLEHQARAVRYRAGDTLAQAKALYQRIVDRARAEGQADHVASALAGIADIATQEPGGTRVARLREGVRILEEALSVASSPVVRTRVAASLAWARTDAALADGGPDSLEALGRAARDFDLVDTTHLTDLERRVFASNRRVCRSSLTQRGEEQIGLWREGVAGSCTPHERATAQHNLAQALLFGSVTRERLREAVTLCEVAAPARANDARHAFQTAMVAGAGLTMALDAGEVLLPWSLAETWARARGWLREAVRCARSLGPGSDLAHAGFALGHVACHAPTLEALTETSDEAWAAVRAAGPFLLFDRAMREREAEVASGIAVALAVRLGDQAIAIASPNVSFLLREERAEAVFLWLRRAQAPLRRPLRARLAPPSGVSVALWQEWLAVLAGRDPLALVAVLGRLRDDAPEFLAGDEPLDTTWRWLEARPGALAVSVGFSRPVSIAALLSVDRSGEHRVQILGLEVPPPPHDAESFASIMRSLVGGEVGATRSHASMVGWARQRFVEPILRFHGDAPSEVLWSPGRGLRAVAPAALWDVPVSCTAGLDLPERSSAPARARSTFLAFADPGPGATVDEFGGEGLAALADLASAASRRGVIRRLASAGQRFGAALLGPAEDLRDRPASAANVLGEAREHDVVVVIAHGEAADPNDAAVLCVSESGALERLDVAALGRAPEAFRGALVVLLSCETGRVGEALAEPGGVAGALVVAGARAVVAPLWPVRLGVAVVAARAVLDALRDGENLAAAIARLCRGSGTGGPALGPTLPAATQREHAALQRFAFVTWVG